jgi:putative phosphoesterase
VGLLKIAIIADIHGNQIALEEVLTNIQKQGIDQYIVLGDIVMGGPEPASVLQTIKSLNPLCWIKGNTDIWFEEVGQNWEPKTERERELLAYYRYARDRLTKEEVDLITALSVSDSITVVGWPILCVHGSPRHVAEIIGESVAEEQLRLMVSNVKESIIVCGHSHVSFIREISRKYIFNVGSVGRPLDGDNRASFGVIDFTSGEPQFYIKRVEYCIEKTIQAARQHNLPNLEKYEKSLICACLSP